MQEKGNFVPEDREGQMTEVRDETVVMSEGNSEGTTSRAAGCGINQKAGTWGSRRARAISKAVVTIAHAMLLIKDVIR